VLHSQENFHCDCHSPAYLERSPRDVVLILSLDEAHRPFQRSNQSCFVERGTAAIVTHQPTWRGHYETVVLILSLDTSSQLSIDATSFLGATKVHRDHCTCHSSVYSETQPHDVVIILSLATRSPPRDAGSPLQSVPRTTTTPSHNRHPSLQTHAQVRHKTYSAREKQQLLLVSGHTVPHRATCIPCSTAERNK
jgi:hypothetical protein